jgi:hypothetical protein
MISKKINYKEISMKIIEVTVSYGQTVQKREFEPSRYFVSIKTEIDITDKLDDVLQYLDRKCKSTIDKMIVSDMDV